MRQRLRDIGEARVEIATIQSAAPDATIEPRAMPSAKTIRLMVRLVVVSTMVVTTLVAWSLGDWS